MPLRAYTPSTPPTTPQCSASCRLPVWAMRCRCFGRDGDADPKRKCFIFGGRMMKGDPATSFSRLDSRAMCSSPLPPLIVARPSLPAKEEHTVGSSGSGKHSLSPSHRIVMVFLDFEIVMAFLVLEISVSLCSISFWFLQKLCRLERSRN
jgi:hypothetical protein